jgi:DNA repair exonuclease SbcCD ATPase subunit
MITLKRLRWDNCFSYGPGNDLLLHDNIVTQIIGTNGMGKSSIPLIIEEALYNKNSKGIKKADIPNRYLDAGYYINLEFSKDEDEFVVEINRKSNIKVKLLKNGEDISSHTATNTFKNIQDILGVDFKTFSQLVYQSTNASLQFLTATDTNRKKFLIDLLHLEEYVELFELFKAVTRDISLKVSAVSSKIDTIEKWLSNNILRDTTILPMLKIEVDTTEAEKEAGMLHAEIENISGKNKKILKNNQNKELLKHIDINKINAIKSTEPLSYDDFQKELGSLNGVIKASGDLKKKLDKLGNDCPTCEQSIDPVFKETLTSNALNEWESAFERRKVLQAKIEEIKENNELFNYRRKKQKEWEDLYRDIDQTLPTNTLDERELKERLERVRAELLRAKDSLAKTAKTNEERTRRNTRIQVIQEQTEEFQKELETYRAELDGVEHTLSNLEVLKKAFSTNGLIAYKIENLVKELEELVNTYLAELSDGRFTLEFVVSNDKLNIEITDNGCVVDILSLSSGEQARVNTATLIAIRKLMSSISKSRLNILFLDEVINVLDESGRERLVEVLLREEGLNTYVVSHGWTHPLLEKIEIVKEDNISVLS